MKTESSLDTISPHITEEDIRSYAEHLWAQSGRIPNRDLDNWFEAKACLEANVPRHESHRRLIHLLAHSARKESVAPARARPMARA